MSGEGEVVCVTAAAGYIASWLVKLLLQHGYTVKATVRDPNDPKETEHLLALDGAKERLRIFKANLLEEGSFDSAVDACDGVFHTASPVIFSANEPKNWYALSKTLAEDAAWKFAEENRIDLVALNPGMVIGPLLQPTLNLSVEIIVKLVHGNQSFPSPYRFVDVRNSAYAHIRALELPSASGRFVMVESTRSSTETLKLLQLLFPTLHLPAKLEDDKPNEPTYKVSKEKAESLGINFVSWEVSLKDNTESLKKKGILSL